MISAFEFMRFLWKNNRLRSQAQPTQHKDKSWQSLHSEGIRASFLSRTAEKAAAVKKRNKKPKDESGKDKGMAR